MEAAPPAGQRARGATLGWVALVAVYLAWGSTYLGIRVAVETLPPFVLGATRFLIAGVILYPIAVATSSGWGAMRPVWSHWRSAIIIGGLMLAGGNGLLNVGEIHVSAGVSALIIATVPLWMVVFDAALGRTRISGPVLVGLALGLAGIGLLSRPGPGMHLALSDVGLLLLGAMLWAAGSLYSRGAPQPPGLLAISQQLLAAGAIQAVVAVVLGEVHPVHVTMRAIVAVAWLVGVGSFVGYIAYIYVLKVLPTATVGTYGLVNPLVAVGLGWLILGEQVTLPMLGGMTLILVGVIFMLRSRSGAKPGPDSG